jgi:surfactin family lipopeptide synthetase C
MTDMPSNQIDFNQLAAEAPDLEQIQQEMRVQRQARPSLGVAYVAPRTPTEKRLAEIWAELLHLDQVGVDDDFFQLGGHSLLAVEVLARINREFSIDISMKTFFASDLATLAEFARIVELNCLGKASTDAIASALQALDQLSDEEVTKLLAEM